MDDLTRLPGAPVGGSAAISVGRDPSSGSNWGRFAPGAVFGGRFRIVAPLGALKLLSDHPVSDPARLAQFHSEERPARTILD